MIDDPLNRLKVKRGEELPHSKLTNDDIKLIHQAVEHRNELRKQASQLSNRSLAEKFGVHYRTIDKVTAGYSWTHL